LNQHYGRQVRIWLVPPLRDHLYFDGQAVAMPHGTEPLMAPLRRLLDTADPEILFAGLRSEGYTHVVVHDSLNPWAWLPPDQRNGLMSPSFKERYLRLQCADRGSHLYRVADSANAEPVNWGRNRIVNSDFDQSMQSWSAEGGVARADVQGDTVVMLDGGARIFQSIALAGGRLYRLRLDTAVQSADASGYVQINAHDEAGNLKFFRRQELQPAGAEQELFQTLPDGITRGVIYVQGSNIGVDHVRLEEALR
jgi:hypothetical protein